VERIRLESNGGRSVNGWLKAAPKERCVSAGGD
jgi:hypothetical protein